MKRIPQCLRSGGRRAAELLAFCRTPRSRDELVEFTGKSRFYTMSRLVRPLLNSGELRCTLPDKPKSVRQRFVTAE